MLPIVNVLANLVHFFFGLPILALFILSLPDSARASKSSPGFPIVVLVQLVLTLGLAFLVAALTVHFRDIKDILTTC